ncbi:MAG: zf-HC2 domain-containing protein [Candidatus Sabulitectum sp.]|nr:zf-HC2 domain-containing protein [Candidatus Sabulitectum sp.]
MTCPDKNTIMMWFDGELTGSEADSISDHIKNCGSCRGLISAQKQMESVWRDAWVDPGDSGFKTMRRKLKPEIPWWRAQRTWFIAAALCAAYIGVKIFYLDGSVASLSDIAVEETSTTVHITEVSDLPQEAPREDMEEMIESECEEQEIETSQDELISGQSEIPEILEELSIDLALSASDCESAGEDPGMEILEEGDYTIGYSGTASNQRDRGLSDVQEEAEMVEEDFPEGMELYRSVSSSSTESAGFGMVAGTLSGGTGGGGSTPDSDGLSTSGDTDNFCDDSIDDVQSVYPAQIEQLAGMPVCEGYSISITLESKETIHVQRHQWDALFSLIDTLQAENCYSAGESLVLGVSIEGILSGHDSLSGTVIELPEAGYGNCAVTVLFF